MYYECSDQCISGPTGHRADIITGFEENGMSQLSGHVALVTGALQGIGRAVALELARAGAKVAAAARNEEKLALLVDEITRDGGEALAIKMDVANEDDVKAGVKL